MRCCDPRANGVARRVGQAARASGLARDLRMSHPWGVFAKHIRHESIIKTQGDVMARLMVRCREILQSADYIDRLLAITSDAQAYKQAGNSVTVNVIEAIGRRIRAVDEQLRREDAA